MKKPHFIRLPENEKNYDQSNLQEFLKRFSTFLGVGTDGHIASIFPNDFDENSKIFIPMFPNVRSINICNSVSIIAYENLRQNNFSF